jgi:hypothetical protein
MKEDMDKYIKLIKQFYPYIKSEVIQAIEMGPPASDHVCNPLCDDCSWYNWGIEFKKRIDKGESDELNS